MTVVVLIGLSWPATAQTTLSAGEQAQFLRTARVVSRKNIPKGVTRPVRLTLTDGTLTHDAAFSAVDEQIPILKLKDGRTELDFVDSYKYSLAAYRLAEMLGIADMMPVSVERELDHQKGAISWWVDDVKWDEGERLKLKLQAPEPEAFNRQMYRMRLFAQLIADTDRNTGNILITSDWKLWMIDFTRGIPPHAHAAGARRGLAVRSHAARQAPDADERRRGGKDQAVHRRSGDRRAHGPPRCDRRSRRKARRRQRRGEGALLRTARASRGHGTMVRIATPRTNQSSEKITSSRRRP